MSNEKKIQIRRPNPVQTYFRETVGELRKVTWPTRDELLHLTRVVLVILGIMTILLGFMDGLFSYLIRLLLGS